MTKPSQKSPRVSIDLMIEAGDWPAKRQLRKLVEPAVLSALTEAGAEPRDAAELSILFSDDAHIQRLNADWRGKAAQSITNAVALFASAKMGTGTGG